MPVWLVRGFAAHSSMTCSKALSILISQCGDARKRLRVLRKDRCNLKFALCRTMRGLGHHHKMGCPSLNQGKMPCEYASISVGTSSTALAASRPGAGSPTPQASPTGGKPSPAANHGRVGGDFPMASTISCENLKNAFAAEPRSLACTYRSRAYCIGSVMW